MLWDQLRRKADHAYVELEIGHLKQGVESAIVLAKTARKASESHPCKQEGTIDEMKKHFKEWEGWFRRALLALLGAVIMIGGGWLWQFFTLRDSVEDSTKALQETKVSVTKVREAVFDLEAGQRELKRVVERSDKTQLDDDAEQLNEIRRLLNESLRRRGRPATRPATRATAAGATE